MIGVLAGMGPMSTAPFIDLLMKSWQKRFGAINDIEFPHVAIYSLPTPFYIDKTLDHVEMERVITEGLLKLQDWGVKLIAMPCNTAHLYFEQLQQRLEVKLLNIIHETVEQVPKNANRVSLLSTQSTFDSNLYQLAIEKVAKEFIFEPHWQQKINALIWAVKTSADSVYEEAYALLLTLTKLKVDTLIIGCTELSEIILRVRDDQKLPMRIVDSSKALVDAILRDSKEGD